MCINKHTTYAPWATLFHTLQILLYNIILLLSTPMNGSIIILHTTSITYRGNKDSMK